MHCCFESDLSGLITVCVSQMEFACSHVVCNWRPGGAGEFPLMLCSNKILYSVIEKNKQYDSTKNSKRMNFLKDGIHIQAFFFLFLNRVLWHYGNWLGQRADRGCPHTRGHCHLCWLYSCLSRSSQSTSTAGITVTNHCQMERTRHQSLKDYYTDLFAAKRQLKAVSIIYCIDGFNFMFNTNITLS